MNPPTEPTKMEQHRDTDTILSRHHCRAST